MSDDTARSADETPVGDTTGEGETEVGPLPSLLNIENMDQADLVEDAEKLQPPSDEGS